MTTIGAGLTCQGQLEGGSQDKCCNRIRMFGPKSKKGVISIVVQGAWQVLGIPRVNIFYFCPNNTCHRHPSCALNGIPSISNSFFVVLGLNLSTFEVEFLLSQALLGMKM